MMELVDTALKYIDQDMWDYKLAQLTVVPPTPEQMKEMLKVLPDPHVVTLTCPTCGCIENFT